MKSEILMQAYKEMRNHVNSDNRSLKREHFLKIKAELSMLRWSGDKKIGKN